MYSIEIADEQERLTLDPARLQQVAELTLRDEGVAAAEISIALVDDARIWEVNRDFLGHDYPTDVISFLLDDDPLLHDLEAGEFEADFESDDDEDAAGAEPESDAAAQELPLASALEGGEGRRGQGARFSGEVVISTDTAAREAAEYGWQPENEVALYLVHGLLHLCGYDDLSADELAIMRAREVEILGRLGLVPRYASRPE